MKASDTKGTIIAHRNDGMGARVIAMLNAVRVARDYDVPYYVGWTTHGRTREEVRDPSFIFHPDYIADRFFDVTIMSEIYDDLIDLSTVDNDNANWTEAKFRKALAKGKRLKAKDPDRVQGFKDLLGDREFTTGARDFLELYAMSRCQQIFGPPSSAFSQTAMTIGGSTLDAVQDALSDDDASAAMDRMTARLEEKSDLFLNMGDVGQCLHFLIEHQATKGNSNRAKRIIRDYMEDGLDKSFAYQLLCELSVSAGELDYAERVRDLAYARPVYVDLTPHNFYPFDTDMVRQKGGVFPNGKKALGELNQFTPKGHPEGDRIEFHPWDLTVRDWRMCMGKRLNRAFTNKSKITKNISMLERSFSKMEGSAALISALGVLQRGMGDLDTALASQRRAIEIAPQVAIYRKRMSDVLYEMDDSENALMQLEKAAEMHGEHPAYMAEMAQRFWKVKRREAARTSQRD